MWMRLLILIGMSVSPPLFAEEKENCLNLETVAREMGQRFHEGFSFSESWKDIQFLDKEVSLTPTWMRKFGDKVAQVRLFESPYAKAFANVKQDGCKKIKGLMGGEFKIDRFTSKDLELTVSPEFVLGNVVQSLQKELNPEAEGPQQKGDEPVLSPKEKEELLSRLGNIRIFITQESESSLSYKIKTYYGDEKEGRLLIQTTHLMKWTKDPAQRPDLTPESVRAFFKILEKDKNRSERK